MTWPSLSHVILLKHDICISILEGIFAETKPDEKWIYAFILEKNPLLLSALTETFRVIRSNILQNVTG